MHPALRQTDHRSWPVPNERWKWRQSWLELAFIHHRVSAVSLRRRLPAGLALQEFDGSAWVGVVPFRMSGVAPRLFPRIAGCLSFPELNVRTYVERDGRPGVWFFSLDATSRLAVFGGRRVYGLPYFRARMSHRRAHERIEFASERCEGGARFAARYRGVGPVWFPATGSFERWMAERYCLYAGANSGELRRVEVHHAPWPVQAAEVELAENGILEAAGIAPLDATPVCHYSNGVDVVSFSARTLQ